MGRISFNDGWKCFRTGHREEAFNVTVPHDAMMLDPKSENSPGGVNTGWYDAQDYTYEKEFFVPDDNKNRTMLFEFEGVYRKATIYINDEKVYYHSFGYTGFYVDVSAKLCYGQNNTIRVEVINSDQPNSRWYSGTGIYRPVWLHVLPENHIEPEGIRVTTLDYKNPRLKVDVKTCGEGMAQVEIFDENGTAACAEGMSSGEVSWEITLDGGELWDVDHPHLYTCKVTFGEDVREVRFGIRMVECTPEKGFCVNGKRVILKGACIHHDNGILGARCYDFAERRKVRLLKENGYNAIRSAHNPCSKAMLEACDEMGMLLVDEYTDMWYIHKCKYDYASEVEQNYKEDLHAIVSRDYNHPSVIMYSTGNEVAETAQKRGIELCGKMTRYLHELDGTRPVTCGINIFFNFLSSMGFGVYSDKKAEQAAADAKKKKAVGSEFFNNLAGMFGSGFMKFGATLYPCDLKTRQAFSNMDVAGYNYGIDRYVHDLKKYPDRLILGSETFCSDAFQFYELAKKNKRIIGDFVWAGMDYLGEVGIGSWEYKEYAKRFDGGKGWVTAGSGRIDLTGKPLAEMKYTQVAFDQEKIGIGVVPIPYTDEKHSPSAWKMSNALESWSFEGCEGKKARIEVYTKEPYAALYINGKHIGTKKRKGNCIVTFETTYENGEIRAAAYDSSKKKTAEITMRTAGTETILTAEPEDNTICQQDLCYVRLKYTDREGTVKPLVRGEIELSVENGELLGFGSACPYYPEGYLKNIADTYYGEALAVIRTAAPGAIRIHAKSGYGETYAEVEVTEA